VPTARETRRRSSLRGGKEITLRKKGKREGERSLEVLLDEGEGGSIALPLRRMGYLKKKISGFKHKKEDNRLERGNFPADRKKTQFSRKGSRKTRKGSSSNSK